MQNLKSPVKARTLMPAYQDSYQRETICNYLHYICHFPFLSEIYRIWMIIYYTENFGIFLVLILIKTSKCVFQDVWFEPRERKI